MQRGVKRKMKKESKGLSPVIATVLLIVIVVIIALIVFLWIKGMTQEAITKFGDRNIEMVCEDVEFEASYTRTTGLYITNFGNVPIFSMDVKQIGAGSHTTVDLQDDEVTTLWPSTGLNTGGIFADPGFINEVPADINEIVLIPILIGESESGKKTYVCNENQYGVKLSVI